MAQHDERREAARSPAWRLLSICGGTVSFASQAVVPTLVAVKVKLLEALIDAHQLQDHA